MHTDFALLCFVVVIHWLIFPYPSGLLHWHCGNLTIAPVPAKQPCWIWINTSCEFIMNDCITTTKQSTKKPCAYFLGYTVPVTAATSAVVFVHRLLSTLFNKVFLSFGIFASYIMQWPLSGPWTGINKILIICIGFVCYKLTRPSDYECRSKYCLHPAFMKQTGIFSIHKTTSKAHDLSLTTINWCTIIVVSLSWILWDLFTYIIQDSLKGTDTIVPDSKVHGADMSGAHLGPTAPCGPREPCYLVPVMWIIKDMTIT